MRRVVLGACSIIRIQSWDSEGRAPATVNDIFGVAWPQKTGTVASGRVDIICVGPTDWLVLAADPDAASWLHQFDTLFQGSTFRATNVSQALVRFQTEGPEVRDLLAKGCSIDLHPPHFPPGRSARTRFAGMPVIVHCTGPSTFECIVTLSYADYLRSWLADAALEFEAATQCD
jgi:sarcosine oxidase subunit gamma